MLIGVAAGAMEGVALNGIEGEGRTMGGGGIIARGVAVAATEGVLAGVADGDAATDGAIEGVALGVGLGDGRILGVGDAAGVALAAAAGVAAGVAVALATGVAVAVAVALATGVVVGAAVAVGTGVVVALATGVAVVLATGVALAAAVAVAAAAGAGVAAAVSSGFTNFFGGALGGGVASALILVRARSAAERSAIAVQPVSIVTSITRSFTVRGRGISRTSTLSGTETSSSSPRIVAANSASVRDCRRKRYRSIGRRLYERISSNFGPSLTIIVFA